MSSEQIFDMNSGTQSFLFFPFARTLKKKKETTLNETKWKNFLIPHRVKAIGHFSFFQDVEAKYEK